MVKKEYHCINNHEIYIFLIRDSRCRIGSEGEASDLLATNTRFKRTIDPVIFEWRTSQVLCKRAHANSCSSNLKTAVNKINQCWCNPHAWLAHYSQHLSTLFPRSHSIPDVGRQFLHDQTKPWLHCYGFLADSNSYPKECHSIVTFIDWLVCDMPLNLFTLHFGRPLFMFPFSR